MLYLSQSGPDLEPAERFIRFLHIKVFSFQLPIAEQHLKVCDWLALNDMLLWESRLSSSCFCQIEVPQLSVT